MNERKLLSTVTQQLFLSQLKWTYAFLGIILIVNIVKIIFAFINGIEVQGYFNMSFVASNFYMFIIGMQAMEFLAYFVGNGVTRKHYIIGNVISTIGLSLFISIATLILFYMEKFIVSVTNLQYKIQSINEIELDGNIIGDTLQMMIISPYVDPNDHALLATIILSVHLFVFYLLGWLIVASFYRYKVVIGLISIVAAIAIKMLKDSFIRIAIDLPAIGIFSSLDSLSLSPLIAIIGVLLIIVGLVYMIRTITKDIPIKM